MCASQNMPVYINYQTVKNSIYSNSDLDLWPNDHKLIGFFHFHRAIMWSSLVKIQYTELKLSCGNDPVVKHSIYNNSDLWPNDSKMNRILPLPQGNHVAKLGKDPIYRTKVIVRKPVWTPASHTQSHNTARLETGV
jgi:hypothetical protein